MLDQRIRTKFITMLNINNIKKVLLDLEAKGVKKRLVNLTKHYPSAQKEVSIAEDTLLHFLEISSVLPTEGENGIEEIVEWTKDTFAANGVAPILNLTCGNSIALGIDNNNQGKVYYFDMDFGLHQLDENIEEFVNKTETPIDFDHLTDEEWDALDTKEYWLAR